MQPLLGLEDPLEVSGALLPLPLEGGGGRPLVSTDSGIRRGIQNGTLADTYG